ncbi:SCO0268 family class II lanthipeptide [Streptomyces sp. SID3343]|uniref:SCO0268 family class II lanthipeptide n=1 Tax=Streptomyces sp. SID3343 TaxID=2690260 RepID=UPI001F333BD6|nr:SCO0268 family class II lanthipeptide [Streptomyces sp. SID3343]
MNDKVLFEDPTDMAEPTDLDLDVRIVESDLASTNFGTSGDYTSPSTYGVQSRCPLCC